MLEDVKKLTDLARALRYCHRDFDPNLRKFTPSNQSFSTAKRNPRKHLRARHDH